MTESRQKRGGKTYRRWGVQKFFWGGVFHPPEFSTPLGRSLIVVYFDTFSGIFGDFTAAAPKALFKTFFLCFC